MPLKIRIKPEGKIFAGGTIIKNAGKGPADLLILSDTPVLRDNYLMNIDQKNESDISNVYFLLQVVYLFRGKGQPLDTLVIDTIQKFGKLYPNLAPLIDEIIAHLYAGEPFKALQVAHKLLKDGSHVPLPTEVASP